MEHCTPHTRAVHTAMCIERKVAGRESCFQLLELLPGIHFVVCFFAAKLSALLLLSALKYPSILGNYNNHFYFQTNECRIKEVPFRGVNCSDAAGTQINYYDLIKLVKNSTTGRIWDLTTLSPYFIYKVWP